MELTRKQKLELIEEAKKRGYSTGILVDYKGSFTGTDMLGSGEFELKDDKLIKYEKEKKGWNDVWRRFDTIWSKEDGWTKIVTEKHGVHQ